MVNVICMKWGAAYGPEYVNILRAMVRRNLSRPHRFVCFTDDRAGIDSDVDCYDMPPVPLPEAKKDRPWRKVGTFAPGVGDLDGPTLFLDLDLVITGSIDRFFDYPGDFCIIENWTTPGRGIGNSSVYRYDPARYTFVYETFCQDPAGHIAKHRNSQTFVSRTIGDLTYWPGDWVCSFKRQCLRTGPATPLNLLLPARLPRDVSIVVFHGSPNPPEAASGIWPKWYKPVRSTAWIKQHWRV